MSLKHLVKFVHNQGQIFWKCAHKGDQKDKEDNEREEDVGKGEGKGERTREDQKGQERTREDQIGKVMNIEE